MDHLERSEGLSWVGSTAASAPALLGVAGGILLGDTMKRSARRPTALVLLGLGLAAAAPLAVSLTKGAIRGPRTRRGREKTLRSIREGGTELTDLHVYEGVEDEIHVGI